MKTVNINQKQDVIIQNAGSIILFHLVSSFAETWASENVGDAQFLGDAFACEPRYAGVIIEGMQNDGLKIS